MMIETSGRVIQKAVGIVQEHSRIGWKLYYLLQLVLVVFVLQSLLSVVLGQGKSYKEFHNTYCDRTNPRNDRCEYEYNFKKILFVWNDGISWDTATPIFDVFPDNQNTFKIRHRDNPWSAWVFSTVMTGKPTRNMGEITNDNLMYQFYLSGMKVLLGAEQSEAYVIDQLNLDFQKKGAETVKYYPKVTEDDDRMFKWLFECSNNTFGCVDSVLSRAKRDDRSIFMESFSLDHAAHAEKSKYGARTLGLLKKYSSDVVSLKQWIDANPEYLLVLVSDHGQISKATDALIHGDFKEDGNEGWVLFYNPSFDVSISTPSSPIILNTVDVAPTIWQFVASNGVSIPAENAGKVYPIAKSAKIQFNALKANAAQVRAFIKKEKLVSYSDSLYFKALKSAEEGIYEQATIYMDEYLTGFTNAMYNQVSGLPFWALIVSIISLVVSLVLQFRTWGNFRLSLSTLGFGITASPYIAWIIYAAFYTQPSAGSSVYHVYVYTIPLCCFLAMYTERLMNKAPVSSPTMSFEVLQQDSTELEEYGDESETVELPKEAAPSAEENSLLSRIHESIKERKFVNILTLILNYIMGNNKVQEKTLEQRLLSLFAFFAVFACIQTSFAWRFFLIDDLGNYYRHPLFVKGFALFTLFLEFRQQRILLTTYLEIKSSSPLPLKQLFHPSFIPLNCKMIFYFVLIFLSFNPSHRAAFFIYLITIVHIGVLVFCPMYIQRDLVLPIFILTLMLNDPRQKIVLCMFVIVLQHLSCAFESHSNTTSGSNSRRYLIPFMVVILVSLGHFYFAMMDRLPYKIDELDLTVPGVEDITKYPKLSVTMIGIHYTGIFVMLIPFLIRTLHPALPTLVPFQIGSLTIGHEPDHSYALSQPFSHSYKQFTTTFLSMGCSLALFFYKANTMGTISDIPLIWCFFLCIVALGFNACVLGGELFDVLSLFIKFVKWGFRKLRD